MFERYTEKARSALFYAHYEASQMGSGVIESEHLLLGLLKGAKSLFESAKIQPMVDELRAGASIERAAKPSAHGDLPLSHPAKKVLAYGAEEAERLKHAHVGPEHLLLALMREPSEAARTLEKYGIRRDRIVVKAHGNIAIEVKCREVVIDLQWAFGPLVERLTPEVEPAVLYTLRP